MSQFFSVLLYLLPQLVLLQNTITQLDLELLAHILQMKTLRPTICVNEQHRVVSGTAGMRTQAASHTTAHSKVLLPEGVSAQATENLIL